MQNRKAYISQKEVPFPSGKVLISKTDTKGIITYCNDEFEKISGFSRAELIGKSHNIVRHPDMPPQAFEWMWDTLKAGFPWRGVVKNRCKNGDHYWVRATVAPIIEHGKLAGYVSVRKEPARAEISAAELFYRELNNSGEKAVSRFERYRFRNWPINFKLSLYVQSALLVMFWLGQQFMTPLVSQLVLQVFMVFFLAFCVDQLVNRRLRTITASMQDDIRVGLESEVDISGRDEVGRLMCSIQSSRTFLRTLVDEISSPVTRIGDRIKDLDSRVATVSANALTEHDHIQGIAATMEEFSQSVAEVASMAEDSQADARSMQNIIAENNQNMDMSIAASSKVADTVQTSSRNIADLGVSIQKIGTIANTIKEIADQTNLLALNAAIEAARAGEQGRGFAVVADEVRKLAERTSASTTDISRTIEEINSVSDVAVKSMQGAVSEVETGIVLIRKNGDGLKEIMAAAGNVLGRIEHISSASREQSVAGHSVAQSLEKVTSLVDSNAHSAQEAKTYANALTDSVEELRRVLARSGEVA